MSAELRHGECWHSDRNQQHQSEQGTGNLRPGPVHSETKWQDFIFHGPDITGTGTLGSRDELGRQWLTPKSRLTTALLLCCSCRIDSFGDGLNHVVWRVRRSALVKVEPLAEEMVRLRHPQDLDERHVVGLSMLP